MCQAFSVCFFCKKSVSQVLLPMWTACIWNDTMYFIQSGETVSIKLYNVSKRFQKVSLSPFLSTVSIWGYLNSSNINELCSSIAFLSIHNLLWFKCRWVIIHETQHCTHEYTYFFEMLQHFSFFCQHFFWGGGGWSYLIRRVFSIVYLNFLSWFLNPFKTCRNIKNSFQLFHAYIKVSALYI